MDWQSFAKDIKPFFVFSFVYWRIHCAIFVHPPIVLLIIHQIPHPKTVIIYMCHDMIMKCLYWMFI